jgi:protein SCO1/2
MKNLSRTKILALIIVLVIPVVFYGIFEWKKHQTGFRLYELPVLSQTTMPDFSFVTHTKDTLHRTELRGKIVIADCIFTRCPGICKDLTSQMTRVEHYFTTNTNFKSDFRLLSFTVDPAVDTVETLAIYAKEKGVKTDKWKFLTGEKDSLYNFIVNFLKLPALEVQSISEPFAHSERMVLIDKEGFIRGYYDGTDTTTVNLLMRDAALLDVHYVIEEGKERKKQKRKKDE